MTILAWFSSLSVALAAFFAFVFSKYYNPSQDEPISPNPTPMPTEPAQSPQEPATEAQTPSKTSQDIYAAAKACLDTHITLDQNVPADLGCAEAVSYILKQANLGGALPKLGFAGTADLYKWLLSEEQEGVSPIAPPNTPQAGDIIISPTGTSTKNAPHGHVGIIGLHGIMSNDSNTGLWGENYTIDSWNVAYAQKLGFPVYIFRFSV